jgi:hypothetical protein
MTAIPESGGQHGSTRSEKLKAQAILSALTFALGLALMIYKIYADSEPGLIPLLLVVLGIGWYTVARIRMRSHYEQPQ